VNGCAHIRLHIVGELFKQLLWYRSENQPEKPFETAFFIYWSCIIENRAVVISLLTEVDLGP